MTTPIHRVSLRLEAIVDARLGLVEEHREVRGRHGSAAPVAGATDGSIVAAIIVHRTLLDRHHVLRNSYTINGDI